MLESPMDQSGQPQRGKKMFWKSLAKFYKKKSQVCSVSVIKSCFMQNIWLCPDIKMCLEKALNSWNMSVDSRVTKLIFTSSLFEVRTAH